MVRSALRTALGAGFMAAAMASASAQVLEIGVDNGPAGLDPHLITAFPSFMVVNGNDLRGPHRHRQGPEDRSGPRRILDRRRRTARPIPSSCAPASNSTTAPPWRRRTWSSTIRRVLSKDIASPLASRLAAVESANAVDAADRRAEAEGAVRAAPGSLATIAIVPSAMEANKDALQKAPVGTGPFKFQEWQPNGFILLAKQRRPIGSKGMPKLAGLKFNIVPESATRQVGLSQRAIRAPAQHRCGDRAAAQGQAEREARRDPGSRLHARSA